MAGVAGLAGHDATVDHQPAAHPGGHHDAEEAVGTSTGALPVLAGRHRHRIVGQSHRSPREALDESRAQWVVTPRRDVQRRDHARRQVERPSAADAHTGRRATATHLVEQAPQCLPQCIALTRAGRPGLDLPAVMHLTVGIDERRGELGPAHVDREHGAIGGRRHAASLHRPAHAERRRT